MQTTTTDPVVAATFERAARFAGVISATLGGLVLLGWSAGVEVLKDPAHVAAMKPNTALCFLLCGIALTLVRSDAPRWQRVTRRTTAAMTIVLSALTLSEYAFGANFGIDEFLFRDRVSPFLPPGRMALATAFTFLLLGLALDAIDVETRGGGRPSDWLAATSLLPVLFGAADYALDWRPELTGMALHTVVGLMLLGSGVMVARPRRGWMLTVTSARSGGRAARRLLPVAFVVPLLVGTLRWIGHRTGIYSVEYGLSLMIAAMIFALAVAVWWNARRLNELEEHTLRERERAEAELRHINRALRTIHRCGEALVRAQTEERLLHDVCRVIVEDGGYRMAWVGLAENEAEKRVRFAAHCGMAEEYAKNANITWGDGERGRGPTGTAIRTGEIQVCADFLAERRMAPWRDSAIAQGFRSSAVFPLKEAGKTFGALSIYSAGVAAFRDEEIELLKKLAEDLAYGIVALRARQERDRIEHELQRERQRFGDVLDRLPAYVVLLAPDYTVPFANKYFREKFGESEGRRCYEYLFQRESPCEVCESFKVLQDGQPRQWDWTGPDGRDYEIYDYVFHQDGSPDMVLEMGIDITARKRAQQAVAREQNRYRSLIVATSQVVWFTNPAGEVCGDMPTWREFTGMTLEQIQGWGWLDSLHPDDRERTAQLWRSAVETQSLYETEYRLRRHDGEYRHVWVRGVPVLESDGAIREWIGTCTDITDRKRAEEKARQASLYARNLLEASLDPLVTISRGGRIMDVNHAAELVTGHDRDRLIGSDFCDYFTEPDKARAGYKEVFKQGSVRDYPLTIRHLSGPVTEVLYNATVYRNPAGEIEGVFAAARDITDRQRAQQALAERTAELERSNKELQDFASIASHDLQEPLRKVMAFGDRLREHAGPALDETGNDYLRRMQNAASRMSSLVEALLEYSRVATKARPFERVDLNVVLAEVLSDLEARIQETGARVEAGALPTVLADRLQMRQLLQNLIANALKFHRPGEPPRVRVSGMPSTNRNWSVAVQDDGIGFDEAYAERIFRPFQRLHGRAEFPGSGMGLAICRKIVDRHGGTIIARSRPGEGAAFTFTLPGSSREETNDAGTEAQYDLDCRGR